MFDPRFLDNFELFDGPVHRPEPRMRPRQNALPMPELEEFRIRLRGTSSPSGTTPSAVVPLSTPPDASLSIPSSNRTEMRQVRSRRERIRLLQQNIPVFDIGPYPSEPPIAPAWPPIDRNGRRSITTSRDTRPRCTSRNNVFDRQFDNKRKTALIHGIEGYAKINKCDLNTVYHPTRRIAQEIEELKVDPVAGVNAAPMNDDLLKWMVVIDGPEDTPYEGGTFFVDLQFPANYPFTSPSLHFRTRIFHPNINCETGAVYVNCIANNWNVTTSIRDILQDLYQGLCSPNPFNCLSPEASALFKRDPVEFEALAKKYTETYA
uniref:UBC core domain-containing protein n=1 Tax=Panagrellus redivivus TaxID=6233 RepID=A0A7E4V698_PANRE